MYCTLEDLDGELSEDNIKDFLKEGSDTADEWKSRALKNIENASGEISGYVAVDEAAIPASIRNACIVITIFKIISRKGIDSDSSENIWYEKYKQAIKFLEKQKKELDNGGAGSGSGTGTEEPALSADVPFIADRPMLDSDFWEGYC